MENSLFAMFAPCISSQAVFNVQQKTIIHQTKGEKVVCTPHSQRFTELDLSLRNVRKGVKSFTLRNIND